MCYENEAVVLIISSSLLKSKENNPAAVKHLRRGDGLGSGHIASFNLTRKESYYAS